ncbi:MAG: addiction module protein [Planctomycetes bacterium]|nr:addiction module protein [Planctomycetota bacterium]
MTEVVESSQRWDDPIVAEVRAVREALFAQSDCDLEKFARTLQEGQRRSGREVVIRSPRRPGDCGGEAIWDSLEPEDVPVTDAQRRELDCRLDDLEREGGPGNRP